LEFCLKHTHKNCMNGLKKANPPCPPTYEFPLKSRFYSTHLYRGFPGSCEISNSQYCPRGRGRGRGQVRGRVGDGYGYQLWLHSTRYPGVSLLRGSRTSKTRRHDNPGFGGIRPKTSQTTTKISFNYQQALYLAEEDRNSRTGNLGRIKRMDHQVCNMSLAVTSTFHWICTYHSESWGDWTMCF
jgi:hypothetical protein